jgi:ABC-type Co2+ transport system permease subunit
MPNTLPPWFWIAYYIFLAVTIGVAIYYVSTRKEIRLSLLTIWVAITVPIALLNTIVAPAELNEFQHLMSELQKGSLWAWYVCSGFLFLAVWWILLLLKIIERQKKIVTN